MASDKIAVAPKITGPEGVVNGNLPLSAMEGSSSALRRGRSLSNWKQLEKTGSTIRPGSPLESSITLGQLNLPEIKGVVHAHGPGLANPCINGTLLGSIAVA